MPVDRSIEPLRLKMVSETDLEGLAQGSRAINSTCVVSSICEELGMAALVHSRALVPVGAQKAAHLFFKKERSMIMNKLKAVFILVLGLSLNAFAPLASAQGGTQSCWGAFGGSGAAGGYPGDGTGMVDPGAQSWAGWAYVSECNPSYPYDFTNGGRITFTGDGEEGPVTVLFKFENQPYPNNTVIIESSKVTLDGEGTYTVDVPANATPFNSFLLYVDGAANHNKKFMIQNTAVTECPSGGCSSTGAFVPQGTSPVPALPLWALFALGGLIASLGVAVRRRG